MASLGGGKWVQFGQTVLSWAAIQGQDGLTEPSWVKAHRPLGGGFFRFGAGCVVAARALAFVGPGRG